MFGLIVLIAAALYCGLMYLAVRFAWRLGRADGGSRRRAFGFASVAFLLVYLPVFWDHIPSLVLHRYQCAKDAGFTAYVDPKEWHAKNAEAVAAVNRLPRNEREAYAKLQQSSDGFERYVDFGGLLRLDSRHKVVVPWLPVVRSEQRIADARTGQVLAIAIDYSAGSSSPEYLRWWNNIGSCIERTPVVAGQPERAAQPYSRLLFYRSDLKGEKA